MLEKAKNRIYAMLANRSFASDDELYRFLILCVAIIFAASMHILLFFITFGMRVAVLPAANLASVAIYFSALMLLVKKRVYVLPGLILVIEVVCYSLLSSFFIGTESYIILYYFVLLLMQLTIPYAGFRVRAGVTAAVWLAMLATLYIGEYFTPLDPLGSGTLAMAIFNIHLAFFGIILELSIGNALQKLIIRYNDNRLAQYKSQANTDPLTGLYNRRYAEKLFKDMAGWKDGSVWCVAMMDIDDFKKVNDSLGHAVGDELLRQLAGTMRVNLRKSDILFRWGGEEFLILLADVDLGTATSILDKLRETISGVAVRLGTAEVRFTVTIGVGVLNFFDVSGSIDLCDERLYQGKAEGKNCVVC